MPSDASVLWRLTASALILLVIAACTSQTIPAPQTQTATPSPTLFATYTASPGQISPLNTPARTRTTEPVPVLISPLATVSAPITRTGINRTYLPFIHGPIPTPPPTATPQPTLTPTPSPTPLPPDLLLGINVADTRDVALLRQLGFGWIEVFLPPTAPVPPFKILYRIELGDAVSGREEDIAQFGRVVDGVVRDHGQFIDAYAIGNEPNLSREWKGGQPDAKLYARLLKLAYEKIKTADPSVPVVSAGLAPTGGDGPGFVDDLKYARTMFEAGAANSFDAYGYHPYGFAYAPEQDPANMSEHKGLTFRRAEAHRALMEAFGAQDKQMWATEFGWLLDPREENATCDWPDANWQKVSAQQQAEYVLRAYRYARANWPWMGPMFVWNFDFSRSSLYSDTCEPMKWYAIVDGDGNLRQVAKQLAKRYELP